MSSGVGRALGPRARALLVFALLAIAVFGRALGASDVFAFRDLVDFTIPQKVHVARSLRALELPLWNALDYAGYPLLANLQSQALYPPVLLVALLPFPIGFNLFLVLHFVLAAAGARALAREAGLDAPGALLCGVAYGFSSYLVSHQDLVPPLATAAWLPWVVRAGLRLGSSSSDRCAARDFVTASITLALAFLAAEPQTTALGALGGLLAAVAGKRPGAAAPAPVAGLGPRESARLRLRAAVLWGSAGLVACLLAAPALLPFLELVSASHRAGAGLPRAEVFRDSFTPGEIGSLVLPGYAGDPAAGTHWTGQSYIRSPYLGAIVAALAASGLAAGGARARALGGLGLLGLLLALGPSGGVYPVLFELGFRQSRYPMKFLALTSLATALLAGRGLAAIAARDRRARGACAAALVLLLALGLLAWIAGGRDVVRGAGAHAAVASLAGGVILLAGTRLARGRPGEPGAPGSPERVRAVALALHALVLLAAIDLAAAGRPLVLTAPAEHLTREPALVRAAAAASAAAGSLPDRDRFYAPAITKELLETVYPRGVADERSVARRVELLEGETNLLFGLAYAGGGDSLEVRESADFLEALASGPSARRLLDLAGARYFLAPYDLSGLGFVRIAQEGDLLLHANPTVLARAFLVGSTHVIPDREARRIALLAKRFDPALEAIVERSLPELDPRCGDGSVTVSRWDEGSARELTVRSPGRCLLVVAETYYPGFEATVDGAREPIERVDHAFRGVVVAEGTHEVRFRYRPRSFRLGLVLALVGAFALGAVAVAGRRSQGCRPADLQRGHRVDCRP